MNPQDLKHIAVLQALDDAALNRLAAVLDQQTYADGQTVFAEGDPGDSMYFVSSGRVRIEMRADAAGAFRKTLTVLESGDYFGEMSLFDQRPRSASAIADGSTRTLRLSKAAFDGLQSAGGEAGMRVLFAMIRTSSERIRRLSAHLVAYDQVGKAIGESKDLQGLLDVVLPQLCLATLADSGLLLLRGQFSDDLELRGQANLTLSPKQREAVAQRQGFLGPILQDPQARLVANMDDEESFQGVARLGFETPSLLVSPISVEAELLGLIVLGGNQPDQFDLDALNLVQGIARQAAQAILNARHREEEQARSRHSRQFVRF